MAKKPKQTKRKSNRAGSNPTPAEDPSTAVAIDVTALSIPEPPLPADRVDQVFRWMLQGGTAFQLEQRILQEWPDAEPSSLIRAALVLLKQSGNMSPEDVSDVRGWCLEATREVYSRAFMLNDFAAALRAIKQISVLAGSSQG